MIENNWQKEEFYFETIPEQYQWLKQFSVLNWQEKIVEFAEHFFSSLPSQDLGVENIFPFSQEAEEFFCTRTICLKHEIYFHQLKIYLAKGVTIEAGATIKPNTIVFEGSEIRQSAYLRDYSIIGKFCTVGHTTEIKNSIVFDHSEIGHFNYVGDSIIGNYCNLGAGSVLCNLPFRTLEQKKKKEFPAFQLSAKHSQISASKKGVLLGDGCETGCNSTLGPMSFVGKNSIIYPNLYISKGVYAPESKFKSPEDRLKLDLRDKI